MNKKQKKMLKRIIVASILFIIIKVAKLPEYIEIPLFLVAYLEIGYDILLKAFKGIRNRQVFDENFLMAVATVGAIGLKSFDEATAVMLFYQIGEWFQSYAVGKSRKNITELMDIRPDYANVEDEDGNLEQVDPDVLSAGRTIGMSEWKIFWKVQLPIAWPGVISGAVLAFARGLGEFGATAMIAGNIKGKTRTLPLAVYSAVASGNMKEAGKYVAVLVCISFIVVICMLSLIHISEPTRRS